jgi:HlyD family secretion protein
MQLHRNTALALTAGVLVLAGAWYFYPRGTLVDTVEVAEGPLVQSVVTSGRIASVARTEVASQSTARIEEITVREGDTVSAGQVLVRLRDAEATASLRQANAAVQEARQRLRQIQTVASPVASQQLAQAQAVDQQAQAELVRAQELQRQGFISASRVDDAQRAALSSHAALIAARAQAQGNAPEGVELATASARLEQALFAEQAAAARLDQLSLRAPVAAKVIARAADPGDTAQAGKSLLTLVSGAETRIQTSVDEKNLQRIALGQPARASADAYPDRQFVATLNYIAPAVDPLRGTVDLRLLVPDAPDYLRPDMTVSVEIITAQMAKTLTLPTESVRRDSAGAAYVLRLQDGKAHRTAVTTGIQGTGSTQIVGGLARGDKVIAGGTAGDGDRVREKPAP